MYFRDNGKRMMDIADDLLTTMWESSPVEATLLGIHEYDHTLGDPSGSACVEFSRRLDRILHSLKYELRVDALSPSLARDHQVALSIASASRSSMALQRYWETDASHYASICIWGCASLLIRDSANEEERAKHLCDRMLEIPEYLAIGRKNLINPSPNCITLAHGVVTGGPNFLGECVRVLAERHPNLRSELETASEKAIAALDSYRHWLKADLMLHAGDEYVLGTDGYQTMLSDHFLVPYTPNELVAVAESVLDEASEMADELAERIEPGASWYELISKLKKHHPSPSELLATYGSMARSARDFVIEHDLLTISDDECLRVEPTPEFERCLLPWAAYFPPAPFGDTKSAQLWVTPVDQRLSPEIQEQHLLGHCSYTIPILAVHEGYPGHHVHLSRLVDIRSPLVKQAMCSMTTEGWALYCEEMMYEQGFREEPREILFQLKDLIWRACRVIIDVGMHVGGMSTSDAIRILVERAHIEPMSAQIEVGRYRISPGQPMSYLIGKLQLLELRDELRSRLGSRFNLKEFHDSLLSYGPIPISLIAQDMLADVEMSQAQNLMRRSA